VSEFPIRAERIDPIALKTRKIIADAERAAATNAADLTDFARQILAGRRQRDNYFDPLLFSNPAWDLLLNLFVAQAEGRRPNSLESCLAASMPHSVAVRWMAYLKQEDMVVERPNAVGEGLGSIQLSDHARTAIAAYLSSLTSLGLGPDIVRPTVPPPCHSS